MLKGTTIKAKVHLIINSKNKVFTKLTTLNWGNGKELAVWDKNNGGGNSADLYFTTDEEPKKGDWCVDIQAGTIFTMGGALETYPEHLSHMKKAIFDNAAKIVATTNPELWDINCPSCGNVGCHLCIGKSIPKIDIPFIEAYIKAYNEGNPITEVLLEQELFITDKVIDYLPEKIYSNEYKLKPKPNGSVIIHPVKERMYTREEFKKAMKYTWDYCDGLVSDIVNFEAWFNQNYPE